MGHIASTVHVSMVYVRMKMELVLVVMQAIMERIAIKGVSVSMECVKMGYLGMECVLVVIKAIMDRIVKI